MKKIIVLLTATAIAAMISACSLLQFDTGKVRTIPKPENTAGRHETDNGSGNSDLDEKGKVLQADTEEYMRKMVEDRAKEILAALRDCDLGKLSQYVHPAKGVRFTAYPYVNVNTDQVFGAEEIKGLDPDSGTYLWGSYDGTGDPIELTFSDYFKRFVYDADFINAKEVNISNTDLPSRGNTIDNSFEAYKNSIIIEYYFPGFDPQYEGMDWRSLRLVFEKANEEWYLVGIIHGEWTI